LFCSRRLSGDETEICLDCQASIDRVQEGLVSPLENTVCTASFYYEGAVREAIHRFKFENARTLALPMARSMALAVSGWLREYWDAITWVPVSPRRKSERGYDQSYLLAKETAKLLGSQPENTLVKVRHVISQNKMLSLEARCENIRNSFAALPSAGIVKRWLLIDDILTSGATLNECARVLWEAGAASVVCAVFAKTRHMPDVAAPQGAD
jgi:ComF family protein